MTTANFTIQTNDNSQIEFIKEFLSRLKIKFEFNTANKSQPEELVEVPEWHKTIVRERIKNSNTKDLLDWNSVKNDFDGI